MVVITGDTHGRVERFKQFNEVLGKDDFLIICGDFGLVWNYQEESKYEEYWLNWLSSKPWTTLWIDGNHENYDRLKTYSVEDWNGGKVQKIRDNVIHLMRGEMFEIEGKKYFTFGGASCHDIQDGILEIDEIQKIKSWQKQNKMFRVNHLSYWKEEMPNEKEYAKGLETLSQGTPHYIITHCAPDCILGQLGFNEKDKLTNYLQKIKEKVDYDKWFCGHYHMNKKFVADNFEILYEGYYVIAEI